jgi:hypothetical protein
MVRVLQGLRLKQECVQCGYKYLRRLQFILLFLSESLLTPS